MQAFCGIIEYTAVLVFLLEGFVDYYCGDCPSAEIVLASFLPFRLFFLNFFLSFPHGHRQPNWT